MRKPYTGSWTRMTFALAVTLLIGGASMTLARNSPYAVPVSSQLIGPPSVKAGQSASYTLRVKFVTGVTADTPSNVAPFIGGALFSAVKGSFAQPGAYTAPAVGPRDRVSASYSENGITTSASRIIAIQ